MNNRLFFIATIAPVLLFGGCKPNDNPLPDEQELITTARITFSAGAGGTTTFNYKVQNGFGGGNPGVITIDTIRLAANATYATSVEILNESVTPVRNITTEIVAEQAEHLFLYNSTPGSGAGSLTFSNGSKDLAGKPFNLSGTITSGPAGSGSLVLYLMHAPTNKDGTTPAASGGETDVQATFPVKIQ